VLSGDRYLTHAEAKELAGLSQNEMNDLIQIVTRVAKIIRSVSQEIGLTLWDGKTELAFTSGETRGFMLVDSIGLDELRLEKDGHSLSKEFLREAYRKTLWFKELGLAKEQSAKSSIDFKELCKTQPPHLQEKEMKLAEALYLSYTNSLSQYVLGKFIFSDNYQIKNWPGEFQ
jgi:phosphoribosylaminoimidazole-succinocarboxamide synthase